MVDEMSDISYIRNTIIELKEHVEMLTTKSERLETRSTSKDLYKISVLNSNQTTNSVPVTKEISNAPEAHTRHTGELNERCGMARTETLTSSKAQPEYSQPVGTSHHLQTLWIHCQQMKYPPM
jgi:hypothetical protein